MNYSNIAEELILLILGVVFGSIGTIIIEKIHKREKQKRVGLLLIEEIRQHNSHLNYILDSIRHVAKQYEYHLNTDELYSKIDSILKSKTYFNRDTYNILLDKLYMLPSPCVKTSLVFFH